jgi:hypothetical protein
VCALQLCLVALLRQLLLEGLGALAFQLIAIGLLEPSEEEPAPRGSLG